MNFPGEILWAGVVVALIFLYRFQELRAQTLEKSLDKLSIAIDKLSDTLDKQEQLLGRFGERLARLEASAGHLSPKFIIGSDSDA